MCYDRWVTSKRGSSLIRRKASFTTNSRGKPPSLRLCFLVVNILKFLVELVHPNNNHLCFFMYTQWGDASARLRSKHVKRLALCAAPLILPSTASLRPEYFSKNGDIWEIGRSSLVNGLQCILLQTLAGSGRFVSEILVMSLLANRLATLMALWEKLNQLQRK